MTEWNDIATAPRDGTRIRVKDDQGIIRRMVFKHPHWWDIGQGQLRIADPVDYDGPADIHKAVAWQELAQ